MNTALIPDQPTLSTPPIARALHLEALAQALPVAQAGQGQAILISGEAGVGKSRLLRELGTAVSETIVVEGNCTTESAALPYAPLIDSLRRHFARLSPSTLPTRRNDERSPHLQVSPVPQQTE
jgi:predicted ATPase